MTDSLISFWREYDPDSAPFVHPADRFLLDDLTVREKHVALYTSYEGFTSSAALARHDDPRLHLGLLPLPYMGDVQHATVFMLMANPGLHPSDYYLEHKLQDHRDIMMANLHQEFQGNDYPFYSLDPRLSWWSGFDYWRPRLHDVLEQQARRAGNYRAALKAVSRVFCVIQLIPYHSARFRLPQRYISRLASANAATRYVHDVLLPRARRGEVTLIVARSRKHWSITHDDHDGRNLIVYTPGQSRRGYLTDESKRALLIRLNAT